MKIYEVILNELFDKNYSWVWRKQGQGNSKIWQAEFVFEKSHVIRVNITNQGNESFVEFGPIDRSSGNLDTNIDLEKHKASRVLSTVVEIVKSFVSKTSPEKISFSGEKTGLNRSSVYSSIIKRKLKELGDYILEKNDDKNATEFILTRKDVKDKQDKDDNDLDFSKIDPSDISFEQALNTNKSLKESLEWHWKSKDPKLSVAVFSLEDTDFEIEFQRLGIEKNSYWQANIDDQSKSDISTRVNFKQQNANKIFSVLKEVVKDFIDKENPEYISISLHGIYQRDTISFYTKSLEKSLPKNYEIDTDVKSLIVKSQKYIEKQRRKTQKSNIRKHKRRQKNNEN